jgi:hypothetical protein
MAAGRAETKAWSACSRARAFLLGFGLSFSQGQYETEGHRHETDHAQWLEHGIVEPLPGFKACALSRCGPGVWDFALPSLLPLHLKSIVAHLMCCSRYS